MLESLPESKIDNLAKQVLQHLADRGYFVIEKNIDEGQVAKICKKLGNIVQNMEIKLSSKIQDIAAKAGKVPFHNDCPEVDIICWYCAHQDHLAGECLYLDTHDFSTYFSKEHIEAFKKLPLMYRTYRDKGKDLHKTHLLTQKNGKNRIYFTPWLLQYDYSNDESGLFKKFQSYLKKVEESRMIKIPLKKHQSVFIDNTRLLHGRNPISSNSDRTLKRTWIKLN